MSEQNLYAEAEATHRDQLIQGQIEMGAKWHAALLKCAGALDLKCGDSLSEMVPKLVARLAAREKLYTETVKALEPRFRDAIQLREELGIETVHLRQLLTLAREASEKGTE